MSSLNVMRKSVWLARFSFSGERRNVRYDVRNIDRWWRHWYDDNIVELVLMVCWHKINLVWIGETFFYCFNLSAYFSGTDGRYLIPNGRSSSRKLQIDVNRPEPSSSQTSKGIFSSPMSTSIHRPHLDRVGDRCSKYDEDRAALRHVKRLQRRRCLRWNSASE